ncbi:MAG: glycosyltransferase, partial [Sphingobacteriales bacterium]|nr:glycosyltransferase [Sphingobacteriales bacterium]
EIKNKYKVEHVYYLPHIIDSSEIKKAQNNSDNFIYLGFIGKNKGIEYSLRLHQQIIKTRPDIQFYVIGKALGKEVTYHNYLKETYSINVHYLDYVPEEDLDEIFDKATFSLQLFNNYKFFWPVSGSILNSLKRGKILLTNKVNTIAEIIENGKNGFFLSGKLNEDMQLLTQLLNNKTLQNELSNEAHKNLLQNHSAIIVNKIFKD